MQQPIDYAGMFPPAKLPLNEAVDEYVEFMEGEDAWIANRFICAQGNLGDLAEHWSSFREYEEDILPLVVVGAPLGANAGEALASLKQDVDKHDGILEVSGFEAKLESGSALKALKKSQDWFADQEIELFLECGWGEGYLDLVGEAASTLDEVGIKARMGGVEAAAFPSVDEVSDFIVEVASLELPFKFTAGLHEPLRYFDENLDCHHHGFLNVFAASLLAVTLDAGKSTVSEVLSIEDSAGFEFKEGGFTVANQSVGLDDIGLWWSYFRGFGSCSLQEPIDGLKRLGLW